MIVRIVGKSLQSEFTDKDTGEVVQGGMNMFYYAPKDETEGYYAGKLWIKKNSPLYNKLLLLNLVSPLMADVVYDIQPGKKVKLVLTDIKLLDEKDFVNLDVKKPA